eukprot:g6648.t1
MLADIEDGIGVHEVAIPLVCFAVCFAFQAWEFLGPKNHPDACRARVLFTAVRAGWVKDNFMKGQAAVNTTRDYIRAALFFANTAILLTTFAVGYAGSRYADCSADSDSCSAEDFLLVVKLGVLAALLMTIFFVFTQCTRYAVHFSFCINTTAIGGVPMPLSLMVKVFNHAHKYYSLGIRLYFGTIPVFAWIFTSWALLAVTPGYVFMVRGLENAGFVQDELDEITRLQGALPSSSSPPPPPPQSAEGNRQGGGGVAGLAPVQVAPSAGFAAALGKGPKAGGNKCGGGGVRPPSNRALAAISTYNAAIQEAQQHHQAVAGGPTSNTCTVAGRNPNHGHLVCAFMICSKCKRGGHRTSPSSECPFDPARFPPRVFANRIPPEFNDFVDTEMRALIDRGCVVKWDNVKSPSAPARPRLTMALSVEPSKPGLIYDARPLNGYKYEVRPAQVLQYLGIVCGSVTMSFRVPADKLAKLHQLIRGALDDGRMHFRTLQRIAGKCMSMTVTIRPASLWTHAMFAVRAAMDKGGSSTRAQVLIDADNTAVFGGFKRGRAKDPETHALMVRLFELQVQYEFLLSLQWVPSVANGAADAISRPFRRLWEALGPFDADLMASDASAQQDPFSGAVLPLFFSRSDCDGSAGVDFFAHILAP